MLVLEKNALAEEIEHLVEQYGNGRHALLQILQEIEKKYSYISDYAQQEIARLMNIHPVEVRSVISFYAFLHSYPQGRNTVRLCKSVTCEMKGKEEIETAIERELGIKFGETTKNKRITLEFANCMGLCDCGPSMLINDRVYSQLDPETAVNLLNEIK